MSITPNHHEAADLPDDRECVPPEADPWQEQRIAYTSKNDDDTPEFGGAVMLYDEDNVTAWIQSNKFHSREEMR